MGLFSSFKPTSALGGAALSGLGSAFMGPVGGAAVGNYLSSAAQQEANEANLANQRQVFLWNKSQTDSAHQRQVQDLKAAGLNPILSAGGSGASSASAQAVTQQPVNRSLGNLAQTAQQAEQAKESIVGQKKQNVKTDADTQLSGAQAKVAAAQAQQTAASAKATELEVERRKLELPNQKSRIEFEKKQREIDDSMMKYDNVIRRIDQAGSAIGSAVSSVIPRIRVQTNTNRDGAMSPLPRGNREKYSSDHGGTLKDSNSNPYGLSGSMGDNYGN